MRYNTNNYESLVTGIEVEIQCSYCEKKDSFPAIISDSWSNETIEFEISSKIDLNKIYCDSCFNFLIDQCFFNLDSIGDIQTFTTIKNEGEMRLYEDADDYDSYVESEENWYDI